jgi:hypothetical protein
MNYEIIVPPKIFPRHFKYFSTSDYCNQSNTPNQMKVFADRYPHLVFQHCDGRSFIIATNKITAFTNHDIEIGGIEIPVGRLYAYKLQKIIMGRQE